MERRFFSWPGWPQLRLAALLFTLNTLWFVAAYNGCNWLTAQRTWRVPIALPGELLIPFVPGMVFFYLSIYPLLWLGPFIVRERASFIALSKAVAWVIFFAGVGFLLLPARAAYPPAVVSGFWAAPFAFADRVNLDYNMVPSLHVALSVCCLAAYSQAASRPTGIFLWTWGAAIAASTLLTHQHHLVDVLTGALLGFTAERTVCRLDAT